MRGLDGDLTPFFLAVAHNHAVSCQEPALHKEIDTGYGLRRNVGPARHPPARAAGFEINTREPRNEAAAKQGEACFALAWDARIIVGGHQSALNRRFDGAANAAEPLVVGKLDRAASAVVEVKLLSREG